MNILTFDIEEWYIAKLNGVTSAEVYRRYDNMLERILALLDERGVQATFFCLGGIAREFPQVVKRIAEAGHEIGCHSDKHHWLTKMTEAELREDTRVAIASLEDLTGQAVTSYRAPAFSIGEANKWALDVLAECGIRQDASIFPAARDFGGYPSFGHYEPCTLQCDGHELTEFPIPMTRILGKEMAFSGGGYFRLLPYGLVHRTMKERAYGMCYFHIADLLPPEGGMMSRADYEAYFKEPGTLANRLKRYVKSNIRVGNTFAKMEKLVHSLDFISINQAVKEIENKNL